MDNTTPSLEPNTSTTQTLDSFHQYQIGNYIWIYISPILLVVGTVGNTLSVIVLLGKRMRKSTTMFYLLCLSFGDLFTLYTGLLRYWMRRAFDIDVRHLSDVACKIHAFLVYLSLDFTVWILVSVTIDRCLSVSLPYKVKRVCSLRRSRVVIVVIILLLTVKNMHFLWNMKLVTTWEFRCDGATAAANHFLDYIWPWIDFTTFCLIPFTIMIICNVTIIYKLIATQQKLDAQYNLRSSSDQPPVKLIRQVSCPEVPTVTSCTPNEREPSTNSLSQNCDENKHSEITAQKSIRHESVPTIITSYTRRKRESNAVTPCTQRTRKPNIIASRIRHESDPPVTTSRVRHIDKTNTDLQSKYNSRRLSSLTALLLSINVVFLVTTTPIQVFLIGEEYWFDTNAQEQIAWHNFWWAVVNVLQYLNNSVHFFLYCLTSPLFRQEFKAVFKRPRRVATAISPSHFSTAM